MRTDSRSRIVNISLELFSETGFTNTTVREIAREVGMRESSLYNHFKSKDEILVEIFNRYKKYRSDNNFITDDLLEKLNTPKDFFDLLAEKLIREWNTDYEKKILRVILMEQFHKIGGEYYSLYTLIEECRPILWMIFDEMIKYRFIKEYEPAFLANEFLYPLFIIRLDMLNPDENKLTHSIEAAKKHVDFFWDTIKKS